MTVRENEMLAAFYKMNVARRANFQIVLALSFFAFGKRFHSKLDVTASWPWLRPPQHQSWYHLDWLMSSESSDEVTAQFCAQFGCNVHAEAGTNKTLSVDIVFIDAIGESERN